MTKKNARKIMLWKAIERYRTAGGSQEHYAYKEALDNYIDDMLDIEEMDEVAHRFAHALALELECVLADRNVARLSVPLVLKPLSENDINAAYISTQGQLLRTSDRSRVMAFARAIEAAIKEQGK